MSRKVKKVKLDFWDELVDLIEEEIELASGVKSKEHHSGKCVMNDIISLVAKELKAQETTIDKLIEDRPFDIKDALEGQKEALTKKIEGMKEMEWTKPRGKEGLQSLVVKKRSKVNKAIEDILKELK